MKKYAVGVNTGTHSIALIAYNEKFVWPKGGLTWLPNSLQRTARFG